MPAVTIDTADVQVFAPSVDAEKAQALITGALARAASIAPCILGDGFAYAEAAKAIIIEAICRRIEAGAGSLALQQAGPFQQAIDTRTSPRVLFWPAEVTELQHLCATATNEAGNRLVPEYAFPAKPGSPVRSRYAERALRVNPDAAWPDPAL